MIICTTDGYVVDILAPYFANVNKAHISRTLLQDRNGFCNCYTAPSRQMVEKWFVGFKRGSTKTGDVVPKHKKVHKMVLADRKLKLREIYGT